MAESSPQTFKNHGRIDPVYHYVLLFLLLFTLFHAVMLFIHHRDAVSASILLLTLVASVMFYLIRTYSLKVQDRVIRLEERMRLMAILPPLLHHRIAELSVSQLVALRFASDKELMALTARVLEEKLTGKEIKAAIVDWRPDYFRV